MDVEELEIQGREGELVTTQVEEFEIPGIESKMVGRK